MGTESFFVNEFRRQENARVVVAYAYALLRSLLDNSIYVDASDAEFTEDDYRVTLRVVHNKKAYHLSVDSLNVTLFAEDKDQGPLTELCAIEFGDLDSCVKELISRIC